MKHIEPIKDAEHLRILINDIGIARFEGRCAAGMIDHAAGEKAIREYVAAESTRPWLSRLALLIADTEEVYKR